MLFWKTKRRNPQSLPYIEATIEDIRRAVMKYEDEMPAPINRMSLRQQDGSLDLSRLQRYLGGQSEQKFYLSRETYEIFPEHERHIPHYLDTVQVAVDDYVNTTGQLPLVENSTEYEVDCYRLVRENYLREVPTIPLYVTEQELMLTHRPGATGRSSKEDSSVMILEF
ncbi:hypothetical protein J2Z69_002051 [Paenibacillus shirakamiensis]|uniref:DUF3939 domain-containing protein n=1 Tax=Paenibacillus shirakamiensis TaxID=1265935 RepID=A0ABS4JH22_9BACL|nr:DUF3939 domain-containing protein [Paenibacillus shirakamiensis]MBP2001008.1 hypothetical protein [Paenibacillus shirakamiensis]